jgi:hypothetical protein
MLGELAFERRESDLRIASLTADVDDAKVLCTCTVHAHCCLSCVYTLLTMTMCTGIIAVSTSKYSCSAVMVIV